VGGRGRGRYLAIIGSCFSLILIGLALRLMDMDTCGAPFSEGVRKGLWYEWEEERGIEQKRSARFAKQLR